MGKEKPVWDVSQKVSSCQICELYGVIGKILTPIKFQETPAAEVEQIYVCDNCLDSLTEDGYVESN